MNFIPLRLKFMFFTVAVLAGVGLLAWQGMQAVAQVRDMAELRNIVTLTKLQMRADMMHDAINGNVIRGLTADKDELAGISKEMDDNIKTAQASFDGIEKLELPVDLKESFVTLQKDYSGYIELAKKTMAALTAGSAQGRAAYNNDFNPLFNTLAEEQDKLEDVVNEYSENKAKSGIADAEQGEKWLKKCAILSIALSIFLPLFAHWSMFRPQRKLLKIADCLSGNDSSVCADIPYGHREDEIGALAKTLITLRSNLETRAELANNFEKSVKCAVDIVASSATEMEATARLMAHSASQSQDKLAELSVGVSGTVSNIHQTSAAVEQIYNSINEIGKQVTQATQVNTNAVSEANQVNGLAEHLSAAAGKVNAINSIITAIAGKINLLSLNATIEAARAGEAGKGFAVVASEVKALANQTAASASEITGHIQSIQQSSSDTLEGVKGISEVISKISEISATIASAIEEQGAGTRDIAKNMKEAAENASGVSANAAFAATLAKTTGESAGQMLNASGELSRQAETLRSEVGSFLRSIRGAS